MEKILWLVLGSVTLVAALRAGSSRRALYVGRGALGALYIAGALVNTIYLVSGTDDFADAAHIVFVRDTYPERPRKTLCTKAVRQAITPG